VTAPEASDEPFHDAVTPSLLRTTVRPDGAVGAAESFGATGTAGSPGGYNPTGGERL
jgi:allophanate hydrolase subunit 1